MSTKMSGKMSGGKKGGSLHEGMSRKNPSRPDASMRCKGGRVDADATRGGTAPTPKSLGGRSV